MNEIVKINADKEQKQEQERQGNQGKFQNTGIIWNKKTQFLYL